MRAIEQAKGHSRTEYDGCCKTVWGYASLYLVAALSSSPFLAI